MPKSLDIEVMSSSIEGLGLFARRPFHQDELIHKVVFEREITDQEPLRPEKGERICHCSWPDGRIMLVASPDRHVNHSCDPNAYYEYNGNSPLARARRRIEPGEEITVDYLINNPGGNSWQCRCGAERCRGFTGTSFFDLPVAFQRDYLPLLAPWFRELFTERVRQLELALATDTNDSEPDDA